MRLFYQTHKAIKFNLFLAMLLKDYGDSVCSVRLILGTPDLFPSLTTESRMLGKRHIGAPVLERFIFQ